MSNCSKNKLVLLANHLRVHRRERKMATANLSLGDRLRRKVDFVAHQAMSRPLAGILCLPSAATGIGYPATVPAISHNYVQHDFPILKLKGIGELVANEILHLHGDLIFIFLQSRGKDKFAFATFIEATYLLEACASRSLESIDLERWSSQNQPLWRNGEITDSCVAGEQHPSWNLVSSPELVLRKLEEVHDSSQSIRSLGNVGKTLFGATNLWSCFKTYFVIEETIDVPRSVVLVTEHGRKNSWLNWKGLPIVIQSKHLVLPDTDSLVVRVLRHLPTRIHRSKAFSCCLRAVITHGVHLLLELVPQETLRLNQAMPNQDLAFLGEAQSKDKTVSIKLVRHRPIFDLELARTVPEICTTKISWKIDALHEIWSFF
mmetsp:Transcript_61113/g.108699  ORF Transcript_61113/g.108699 Transcript_61113/m.108699 type:complete len:375 (+) Transcript_61113:519-1643(+)